MTSTLPSSSSRLTYAIISPVDFTFFFFIARSTPPITISSLSEADSTSQWVFALGVQYKPTKQLALRAGYNYANNPVREHDNFVGFNGTQNPPTTFVQGIPFPTYYFETFRIIGFPAVAEQHISFGIGYELSNKFALNAGYTHAFEHSISEIGTTPTSPVPVSLKSTLSENSIEFGITWRF